MPREHSFTTQFCAQFQTATLLTKTYATTAEELAPSDFPAFSLQLGKSSYHGLDNDGFLYLGSQEFTLRIFLRNTQLSQDVALNTRGVYLGLAESFISHSFTPDPYLGGDTHRVTGTELIETLPPIYDKLATTQTIALRGKYSYVFL